MYNLAKTQSREKYTRHTILTCTKLVPCRQRLNSVHIPTATQTTKYFSCVQRTHTTSSVTHVPTNDTAPIFYLRNLLLLSLFYSFLPPFKSTDVSLYGNTKADVTLKTGSRPYIPQADKRSTIF